MMIAGTSFVIIEPRHAWAVIHRRVNRTRSQKWTYEEVAEVCDTNAVCLSCLDGVVVIKLIGSERVGLEAEVALAVSTGRFGAFRRMQDELMAVLRDMGARTTFFRTDRPGWQRMLGPHWHRHGDLYERSV